MVFSDSSRRAGSSPHGRTGGSSTLLSGRKPSRSRTARSVASSVSWANWATPDLTAWTWAPPSSSRVTRSRVVASTAAGPLTNIEEVPFTMKMKSVMAGL